MQKPDSELRARRAQRLDLHGLTMTTPSGNQLTTQHQNLISRALQMGDVTLESAISEKEGEICSDVQSEHLDEYYSEYY
jgi:hypothetical protein